MINSGNLPLIYDSGNHNGNIEDFDFFVYSHLCIENEISNPFLAQSSIALVSMGISFQLFHLIQRV